MPRFRHLSLDLWLTLIRSSPAYKPARNALFAARFGIGKSPAEVDAVFRHYDLHFNAVNEQTGGAVTVWEMYYTILSALGGNVRDFPRETLEDFYRESEALLFEHPPQILHPSIPHALHELRAKRYSISLLSNTGFILGSSLRKMMPQFGLDTVFDFQLYSDEEGASKPSPELFARLVTKAKLFNVENCPEILHIGDNALADFRGAKRAGLSAVLFNAAEETLPDLLSRLFSGRADEQPCTPLSQHIT